MAGLKIMDNIRNFHLCQFLFNIESSERLTNMKVTKDYYTQERPEVAAMVPQTIRTILDIGCAQGVFLKLVKERTGAETWGIEMEPEVAEVAKRNVENVLTGKLEDLIDSIPDAYFDCVIFNDVLEHLLDPWEALKMIRPKLSETGIVIASIPNVRYFGNLYELILKKDWEYKDAGILDSTHLRFFTKISMKRLFEEAGYRLIRQEGIREITSWRFRLLNRLTFGFIDDSKYLQFVCIAR
jgi:2-polyprenyl-3-methyl-5-hydroxy-6-metoxy-1,4-benzoquinol methylase